jgi:hypothetical protein
MKMCSKRARFRAISDPIGHKRTQAGPDPFRDNPKPKCTGGGRVLSRAPSRSIGAQMEAGASHFGAHFGQNVRERCPAALRAHFCPNVRERDAPRRVASALSVQSCLKSAQPHVAESTAPANRLPKRAKSVCQWATNLPGKAFAGSNPGRFCAIGGFLLEIVLQACCLFARAICSQCGHRKLARQDWISPRATPRPVTGVGGLGYWQGAGHGQKRVGHGLDHFRANHDVLRN